MSDQEQKQEKVPLEKMVERLEQIVEQLESGDADLEKSIDLYREGKTLGGEALKRLDALERRIEVVTGGEGEDLETDDFPTQAPE